MKIDLTHIVGQEGKSMGDSDCGGGIGSDDMYRESTEPMLVSLSDLYSDEDRILGR